MTHTINTQTLAIASPPRAKRAPLRFSYGWVGIAIVIGAWALLTETGVVSDRTLPSPSQLIQHTGELLSEGYRGTPLIAHVLISMQRTAIGLALAIIFGVPLGLAMGYFRRIGELLSPMFALLRPIPPIAFIPLAVLYLGLGEPSKIVLIFLAPFMFIVLNAEAGVRSVSKVWIRAGEMLGFSHRQLFTKVILPGSMPSVMVGIRTGAAVSWALVVAAELISAQAGIGYMVASAGAFFDLKTIFVGIIIIGIIGFLLDMFVRAIEKRVLHWQGK